MTILSIRRMGESVLARRAEAVADPTDPAIAHLAADMAETLAATGGVGLAAPQVGVALRVVVIGAPARGVPAMTLVNPVLEPMDEARVLGYEGCLSLPGLTGKVPRFARLAWSAQGLDGRPIGGEAEGYHARVLQHECDHLDGVLYPARITDWTWFGFADEIRRRMEEEG